jgi:hypothetical protein
MSSLISCSVFLLLVVAGLIGMANGQASQGTSADCNLNSIQLYRVRVDSPDTPIVQLNPPVGANLLGFPPGFSPFLNLQVGVGGVSTIIASTGVQVPDRFIIAPVTDTDTQGGIRNGRLFLNFTVGVSSTPGFAPNVTLFVNGQIVLINGQAIYNTQKSPQGPGTVLIELFNIVPGNNTILLNVTGFVQAPQSIGGGFSACGRLYAINISNPNATTPSVVGDPQFMGLRGQTFQVHGIDGAVYNVISDKAAQVNSRFVFLNGPRACPIMPSTGKKSKACWSHPGSYLGEIGIMTSGGDRVFIRSGPAATGFTTVTLNDEPLAINDAATLNYANSTETSELHFLSSHELYVHAGPFLIELENIDSFVNLRSVSVAGHLSKVSSHGLLGQTWSNKRYPSSLKVIQGEVDDYVIADDEIFGTQFMFNQFSLHQE